MGNNTNMKKKTVEKNERIFCKACGTDVTVIQTHHCLYGIAFGCQPPKEILEALNRYIKEMKKTNNWEREYDNWFFKMWPQLVGSAVQGEIYDLLQNTVRAEINRVLDELKMEEVSCRDSDDYDLGWDSGYNKAVQELDAKIEEIRKEYK